MRARWCALAGVLLLLLAGCGPNREGPAPVTTRGPGFPGAPGAEPFGGVESSQLGSAAQRDLALVAGDRVFFEYDRADISPEAQHILERQAEWLKRYPQVGVTIEGHTDERGTREYNLSLGERRAQAVKNVLVALGVPTARIETISYGKERPVVVHSDEQSFAQNRRGVTIVR